MKKHLKTCLAILFSIVLAMNSVLALALDNDNEQEMSTVENGENYEGVQGEDSEEVQAIDVENSSKSGGEAGEMEETLSEETGQETTKQEYAEDVITTEEIRTEETAVEETAVETTAVETTSEAITGENEEETTEEMTSEAITEESEEDSVNMPEFTGLKIVDGVVIMVTAPEGVFPEESTLLVNKVSNEEQQNVDNAVDKTRNDNVNVAASYTYDIKVLNKDGEEIQPADEQKVKVIFTLAEAENENLTADIYHITGENGDLSAEALDTTGQGAVVMAESDGFSYYTVEFTYGEKQYVMQGDSAVALTDILSYVGITKADGSAATDSDITAVSVSDESLFSASNESGKWIVTAHQAFHTDEWMKVTVDGVEYEIVVTDDAYTTNKTGLSWNEGDIFVVNGSTYSFGSSDFRYVHVQPSRDGTSHTDTTALIAGNGQITLTSSFGTTTIGFPSGYNAWMLNRFSEDSQSHYYFSPTNYNPNYTVTYNTNAGSDSVSGLSSNTVTISQGSSTTLPNLTRTGYSFDGWYTATSGGTKAGDGGVSYTPQSDITLYAHWKPYAVAPTITGYSGTYDANNHSVTATGGSGGTVYYRTSTNNSSWGNWSTTVPSRKDVGILYVQAYTKGDESHNDSKVTNSVKLEITKKTVTVSGITANNKSYDGSKNATLGYTNVSYNGIVTGDTLTVSATGTFDNKNVGNGKTVSISNLSLSGASAGNYQLATSGQQVSTTADITAKSLQITADAKSKTYGDSNPELTYTSNGLVSGDSITGSLSRVSGENIGTYAIQQGTLSAGSNYIITYTGAELTISKKALNITADEKSKVYGSEDPALTYTVNGLVNGDTEGVLTGSLVRETGENVGAYAINQGTLSAGDNYTINYISKNLSITQKEVGLIWGNTVFTYNGEIQMPTATVTDIKSGDTCTVTVTGGQKNVGNYNATASELSNSNYKLPTEKSRSFTISKKAANITANEQTVTYGTSIVSTADQVVTEGLVTGDTLTAITLTPSTSDVTTAGTITPSDAVIKKGDTDVTNNYDITFNTGNLKINKKPITISGIKASNKTYDGTTAATLKYNEINWVDCGKVGDDDLSVTATGVFSDANIGTGKNVTISDLALSGTKADNYELASSGQQTSTTADISAKALTIKADSDTKVYDGATHTKNSYSVTSGVLAEGDTVESVTVTGSQKYAGSSANVPSDAVIKNSSDEDVTSNYNITYTNGTLTVTKKPLTITADSDTKVYDTTPLTKNNYTNTALAAGDTIESVTVTGSQTAVGESANKPSAAVIKNGNEDVTANYDITYVNGTLKVTKKEVTITADSDTKVYDGTLLTKESYTVSGLEAGDRVDSVTITGSQTKVGTGNNVPSAAVIKNTNGDVVTANYEIEYVNGTLEVTKKTITITADSDTKVYDGTALTKDSYTNSELAAGDTIENVTVTGSQISAGEGANVPSAAVIKNAANEDVTASYDITYKSGTLKVTPKAITITADDAAKVYDGTALTKDSYTNSDLAAGDSIKSVTITGSQTDAGESTNVPSAAVIMNAENEDVTASYDITYENGTLEVTQKPVTISGISVIDKIYDGTTDAELDYSDIDWSACGMVDGDELSVTAKGTYEDTSAGEDKSVTITDITIGGTSVDNYILADDGHQTRTTAKIMKKSVTVTALKQTVAVNGEIENTIEYAELSGAVEGHKLAEITLTSGSTEKTTTEGVITPSEAKIVDGDIDVTDNYDITYIDGVMTVTKAEAEVVLDNGDDEAQASVTAVEVPNLLELADEEAEEGKLVKVELSVKPVSENKVNAVTVSDVKKTVESLFAFVDKESVKVEYLEIDLTKYIDNVKDGAISDTGTPLEIILTYDTSKAGNPVIIRSHEGTVKVFTQLSSRHAGSLTDATYYVEGNKIYMYSQYFSDFAIAYSVDKTFNVNLDDGNGNVTRQIVSEGAKFIPPADLAKDGYDFGGWYKDEAFTQKWNPDTDKVTSDIKLYAKWTKKAEPSKSDTPETKVDTPKAATTPGNTAKSPATGDAMHKDIAFFLMIFAALGMICIRFIKKKIQDR